MYNVCINVYFVYLIKIFCLPCIDSAQFSLLLRLLPSLLLWGSVPFSCKFGQAEYLEFVAWEFYRLHNLPGVFIFPSNPWLSYFTTAAISLHSVVLPFLHQAVLKMFYVAVISVFSHSALLFHPDDLVALIEFYWPQILCLKSKKKKKFKRDWADTVECSYP